MLHLNLDGLPTWNQRTFSLSFPTVPTSVPPALNAKWEGLGRGRGQSLGGLGQNCELHMGCADLPCSTHVSDSQTPNPHVSVFQLP